MLNREINNGNATKYEYYVQIKRKLLPICIQLNQKDPTMYNSTHFSAIKKKLQTIFNALNQY